MKHATLSSDRHRRHTADRKNELRSSDVGTARVPNDIKPLEFDINSHAVGNKAVHEHKASSELDEPKESTNRAPAKSMSPSINLHKRFTEKQSEVRQTRLDKQDEQA